MTYGNADDFITYHQERGNDVPASWGAETVDAALLIASEWIDGVYGPSFIGYKTGGFTQTREWPRTDATVYSSLPYYTFATDAVPDRVKKAAYEAAYRHLVTPGSLDVDYTPGKYRSVSVEGAIDVEYVQFSNASEIQMQIGAVDKWLWPLLDTNEHGVMSGHSGRVSRV